MGRFLDLAFLIFGFQTITTLGQAGQEKLVEEVENPSTSPSLAVSVDVSFPAAEIFGIKIVNGKPTESILSFSNEETESVVVQFVGGSLWTPDIDPAGSRIVRNLTTKQYNVIIPPGEKQTLPFNFQTNMHPQELRLNLAAVVSQENTFYTIQAFNGTVAVVDPDSSIFDPQIIFLYLFLLACALGVGYLFYNIWIVPYFPKQKRSSTTTKRVPAKAKVDAGSDLSGAEGPAVSTGANAYEEWIPSHHLQRPEARRVKSGGPRPKSRGNQA